jgi:hypothetical protein
VDGFVTKAIVGGNTNGACLGSASRQRCCKHYDCELFKHSLVSDSGGIKLEFVLIKSKDKAIENLVKI